MASEEFPHQRDHLVELVFQGEMAGIEVMPFCLRQIAQEG
jgi:hypothetical protein